MPLYCIETGLEQKFFSFIFRISSHEHNTGHSKLIQIGDLWSLIVAAIDISEEDGMNSSENILLAHGKTLPLPSITEF